MKLAVVALLLAPLLAPVAVGATLPPLCPTQTSPAVLLPPDGWAYNAWTRIDFFRETNGVAGLQRSSCTTLDGVSVPADAFQSSIFLPVCIGTICIL